MIHEFLRQTFLDVPYYNYLIAALLTLIALFLKRNLSRMVAKILFKVLDKYVDKKYLTTFQEKVLSSFQGLIVLILFFFVVHNLGALLDNIVIFERTKTGQKPAFRLDLLDITDVICFFGIIFYVTLLISRTLDFISIVLTDKFKEKDDKERQQVYPLIKDILKVLIWTIGIFIILKSVFKVDVTALIAGLGIGGIAVAFALKDSLENLLASILIMIDKPFLIGDWIKVNGVEGNVEKLGFRNTMIRSFDKTLISLPNKNLLNNNLENFSQRGLRRVKFEIGANYGLSEATLRKVAVLIKENIEEHSATVGSASVELDRFGDSALVFAITYFVSLSAEESFAEVKEDMNYMIYNIMFTYAKGMPFPTVANVNSEEINEMNNDLH